MVWLVEGRRGGNQVSLGILLNTQSVSKNRQTNKILDDRQWIEMGMGMGMRKRNMMRSQVTGH